jgi:hypothetical protein
MLTWLFVVLAMLCTGVVGGIASIFLVMIEKPIQWGGRNLDEWKAMGIECPGERLPGVAFFFGLLSTTLTRGLMYMVGTWVFIARGPQPSIIPMLIFGFLLSINDCNRIKKAWGSAAVHKEAGYFWGGIVAFGFFLWLRTMVI